MTYELRPFSTGKNGETAAHLRQVYTDASDWDCLEFHRLTGGNPRVQANALAEGKDVAEVLSRLGPAQHTVASQIASQLEAAVSAVKDRHVERAQIDAICRGLANLPPFVPLAVLAKAAEVDVSTVRSFISDLGRPLWHTDDAVQFRDEPTETWFREKFSANKGQIIAYLAALEPLAKEFAYVAKAVPQLLLRSENHDRLVKLALSDELLPENNPIDERDIRLHRLQFAFKAALRLGRYADAARLAFRAGEETAGNERQLSLLQTNLHLIAPLQGAHRIQEIAYRRAFTSAWEGSQNAFSASLLSAVKDFHGEARTYLRTANRWLKIHFAEQRRRAKEEKKPHLRSEQLQDTDIAELSWACLNLYGPSETAKYLTSWRPPEFTFLVARLLISRLVDAARFPEIDEIARAGAQSIYLILAVADELAAIARFPLKDALRHSLGVLAVKATRIQKPQSFSNEGKVTPAIQSLLEASAARGLSRKKIQAALKYYAPAVADWSVGSNAHGESRPVFLRGVALRAVLEGKEEVTPSSLLPRKKAKKSTEGKRDLDEREEQDITQCISALLPWYLLRAQLLVVGGGVARKEMERAEKLSQEGLRARYYTHDPLRWEISRIRFELLALNTAASSSDVDAFIAYLKTGKYFSLQDRLNAARAVFRIPYLHQLRVPLEVSCRETIEDPGNEGPELRASWFTSLARAVLPTSTLDAAAYLNQAVEAVSKYGDEVVDRWEAIVAVARRASEGQRSTSETAYRFIRCGEMVGDTVAREKYWERDDVFKVAVHLDAPSAFSALSRWRDRGVGSFDEQLSALANEAVKEGTLSPRVAWCLSGFEGCNGSAEFGAICVQRELSKSIQQRVLDTAVHDLELAGTSPKELQKLEAVADAAHLSKAKLNGLTKLYASTKYISATTPRSPIILGPARPDPPEGRPDECLDRVNLLTSEGIGSALEKFRRTEPPRRSQIFWREVVRRVPAGRETEFLRVLNSGTEFGMYEMDEVLNEVRANWLGKAAVERAWPNFLKAVGRRLATSLSAHRSLAYFRSQAQLDVTEVAAVKCGIIDGLGDSSELMDAGSFFGFVTNIVDRLSTAEASDLLDHALARFERHIDDDYADGLWSDWLRPSLDVSGAVVGLIWSALGSPYSSTRWEAAHCVRRLAENLCENEIGLLLGSMQSGTVGPFGSHRFPFYDLHAKLYLLIALARAAVDDPTVLTSHASIFAQIALEGMPHILIQKTAADVALLIERARPLSYAADVVARLRQVGRSPLPPKVTEDYPPQIETPWHIAGQVDLTLDLSLGYDFERYWLEPLGSVFGISNKEVVQLGRDVAIHNLRIPNGNAYPKDPRKGQWEALERFEGSFNTWHSHGCYPRVDNYTFYYSYHACLALAAKVLAEMPVIRHAKIDFDGDRWEDWLARHLLTRSDGKWLADRRDATPTNQRAWVDSPEREHWQWSICADDFIEMLRERSASHKSLCVSGLWKECDGSREEEVSIASALVDPASAESVATALRMSDETHWSALPRFGDQGPSKRPAELIGWIRQPGYGDRKLDGFDPYAREIGYPPREIGGTFVSLLGLSSDSERRNWRLPNTSGPSLICEVWSDKRVDERDKPFRFGERINASAELLMLLCTRTRKDLLFEVIIKRRLDRRYAAAGKDEMGLVPPSRKIFVLSSDGILREKERHYRLR